jgi:hypothetical protein
VCSALPLLSVFRIGISLIHEPLPSLLLRFGFRLRTTVDAALRDGFGPVLCWIWLGIEGFVMKMMVV